LILQFDFLYSCAISYAIVKGYMMSKHLAITVAAIINNVPIFTFFIIHQWSYIIHASI